MMFFFSSRRRHTRCALVNGVQTCALPIFVGRAAAVEAVAHLGRLERGGVPLGVVVLGLYVVVRVEQDRLGRGRVAGLRGLGRHDGRGAAVGAEDLRLEALGGEQVAGLLGTALHLARARRVRSEERRGGKEWGRKGRSRWTPGHKKKK